MRYKEEMIAMLKAQVDALTTKLSKADKIEEREKDIEKTLKQTHSEMVNQGALISFEFISFFKNFRLFYTRIANPC